MRTMLHFFPSQVSMHSYSSSSPCMMWILLIISRTSRASTDDLRTSRSLMYYMAPCRSSLFDPEPDLPIDLGLVLQVITPPIVSLLHLQAHLFWSTSMMSSESWSLITKSLSVSACASCLFN
ncbi:hypothetical protein F5Y15DRAFT_291466 [Xylariaceae sp. FL0016]|nr:hypothetical protein F5Y15DRAFT_291466 [Xylariaceae sp. FL0016]